MPYVVVFYDVSDNKRRDILAKTLQSLGLVRVQRSVFMGRGGYTKAKEAIRAASRIVDARTDSVVALVVPEDYARRMLVYGGIMGDPKQKQAVKVV